jgi:hypothetical protein
MCLGSKVRPMRWADNGAAICEAITQDLVRLEGLGKLKNFIQLIGTGTRDLPTCSVVPQPLRCPVAIKLFLQSVDMGNNYNG